ncbi:hypothetical protein CDIK_3617 [Cucumispora dikerogammari]|nr:hypothetical protein CDIK_3617 [Cucumispora dikerogammari]
MRYLLRRINTFFSFLNHSLHYSRVVRRERKHKINSKHLIKDGHMENMLGPDGLVYEFPERPAYDHICLMPANFTEYEVPGSAQRVLPFMLLPLFEVDDSSSSVVFQLNTSGKLFNALENCSHDFFGNVFFRNFSSFFKYDDVVNYVLLNGKDIKKQTLGDARRLCGYLILREPFSKKMMMYLEVFIEPHFTDYLKTSISFKSDQIVPPPGEIPIELDCFEISLNISSFRKGLCFSTGYSRDYSSLTHKIVFDQAKQIKDDSNINIKLEGKIEESTMYFEVKKTYSSEELKPLTCRLIKLPHKSKKKLRFLKGLKGKKMQNF